MTTTQNALAAGSILLTGESIATFLSEHSAFVTAFGCLAIFAAISYSVYRNRHRS